MTNAGILKMCYGVDGSINLFPIHIYDQNDNNLTSSYLYLKSGDKLILEPRFYGISVDQIEEVEWYTDSGWYEISGTEEWGFDSELCILDLTYDSEAPYKAELTVKNNAEGEDRVYYWIKLAGVDDYYPEVSFGLYIRNTSATVSYAPSVLQNAATMDRNLRRLSPLVYKQNQ